MQSLKMNSKNYVLYVILIATSALSFLVPTSAYKPVEDIALNCGFHGNLTAHNYRLWIGDHNSTSYSPIEKQPSSVMRNVTTRNSTLTIPYSTARFSRSKFTFSFSVNPGPKFVRLHFHVSDHYLNFSKADALFSVICGNYTLLRNFSASLMADYLATPVFSKEYSVYVQDDQPLLNITLVPSAEHIPDAYAFINGIEIVSMPLDLYYSNSTDAVGSRSIVFLGNSSDPSTLTSVDAMETMYRLNVGGADISSDSSTDMYRGWSPDDIYLTEDVSSVLPVNSTITLTFDMIPNYTAPEDIYRTARSMGTNRTINTSYNLTWSFPVDSNFTYIVRLHFCEFQREISKLGDRVFEIFIASQEASLRADVIRWTGGRGIPIYRDYVVNVPALMGKKINLTVALCTAPEMDSVYADALLNGVEVIKVSSYDGNLAGPNLERIQVSPPEPDSRPPIGLPSKSASTVLRKKVAPSVAAGAFTILVVSLLCCLIFRRGRGADHSSPNEINLSNTAARQPSLPPDMCHHFSLSEIRAATGNFHEGFIIGVGGFGNVYRGHMCSGSVSVAIKRLNPGSQQGAREFVTEIEMLSRLRHRHLVLLIGFCHEAEEMILVYDYMSRGTLRDHLYNTENPPLPWKQRLEICLGAARGLQYLHMGTKHMIIHRDIKTTNILLDERWTAKVSDFGLSKMRAGDMSKSHISTVVKGTFGYLDPEYFRFHQLTEKSDVYSFGVVLFEVLCARAPVDTAVETEQISLAHWVQSCYQKGSLDEIIDPKVKAEIMPECLEKFAETAASCLRDKGMQRPSMNDIVRSLELALELQEMKAQAPALAVDATLGKEDSWSSSDPESNDEVSE